MADVPGHRQALRIRQARGCVAFCVAVLLATMPLGPLSHAVAPKAAPAASASWYASGGDAPQGEKPALGLRGARAGTGILPRLLHLEAALAPPPPKASLLKLPASIDLLAKPEPKARPDGSTGPSFHRSSVGTARAPTGPPA